MSLPRVVLMGVFVVLASVAMAQEGQGSAVGKGKIGFGFDRGFGVTGAFDRFYGFIGNDGLAVDYQFHRRDWKLDMKAPAYWYIGAGGFFDWDDDLGVRVPVGAEIRFARNADVYAQAIPYLQINDGGKFGLGLGVGVRYLFE